MASVRRANTAPEMVVRRILHNLGCRFRLHRRDLPGTPDIVLPRFKIALFVHGCFWHRHDGCRFATTPKTRTEFWSKKFGQNVARDARNEDLLRDAGWSPIIVWGCETRDVTGLKAALSHMLAEVSEKRGNLIEATDAHISVSERPAEFR